MLVSYALLICILIKNQEGYICIYVTHGYLFQMEQGGEFMGKGIISFYSTYKFLKIISTNGLCNQSPK